MRATEYIEREVRRLGLKRRRRQRHLLPEHAGDGASDRGGVHASRSGSNVFHPNTDFAATANADRQASGEVIFGGTMGDTINALSADDVRGKVVIALLAAAGGGRGGFWRWRGGAAAPNLLAAGAAAVLTVTPTLARPRALPAHAQRHDAVSRAPRPPSAAAHPESERRGRGRGRGGAPGAGQALAATITPAVATALLGKPVDQAARGDKGPVASFDVRVENLPAPTRNVVAILPGTDPKLRNEYIVIGAHADHVGISGARPIVEHDSLKAYNMVARVEGADSRNAKAPTAEEWTRINAIKDSLRRIYPARLDSISNGADDDGSGSVSILEIAEAFAKGPVKPKRSLIFIWQIGEEKGLWGSQWFTNHPTISRDSIVADLNLDMVGRGEATDVTGTDKEGHELRGAANYLQLVGSRRLSTELGDIAEQISAKQPVPFKFDYALDANGHPQNIYCRSDHANYARYGIPVIFFTTGGHADYHQVTDEPEYIQYRHMAAVDKLVFDIAVKVADLDHRVKVDKEGGQPVRALPAVGRAANRTQ